MQPREPSEAMLQAMREAWTHAPSSLREMFRLIWLAGERQRIADAYKANGWPQ